MSTPINKLTSGRLLARSAAWNLIGITAPVLVALFVIPLLIDGMGTERFGLLAIIWMGVGYFSVFDLGLGRALTKLVSERLGKNELGDLGALIWTALTLLMLLGFIGAGLLIFFSPSLVTGLLQVPEALHDEAISAFRILAIGIPFVILTAAFVGLLEAHQRFNVIAAIRVPLGVLTFAGPLVTLQFSPSIAWATTVLLLGRALAMLVFFWAAAKIRDELTGPIEIDRHTVRPLVSFGGWLTLTNIVGPLMTYLDRFFISAILGLSAVAYYVTPYEILTRMQVLAQAVMGVTFPAMAAAHGGDPLRMRTLFGNVGRVVFWSMFPITSAAFLFSPDALTLWLGEEFQIKSAPVAQLLALGCMINILAMPAFTVLQASGRPDLVAKVHILELGPYLGLIWWLANSYGITGVAAAWALRVGADALILNVLAAWQLPILKAQVIRTLRAFVATVIMFAAFSQIDAFELRLIVIVALTGLSAVVLWPTLRLAARQRLTDDPQGV